MLPLQFLHFPIQCRNTINMIVFKLICKAQSCRTWRGTTNLILPGIFSQWLGQGLPKSPPHRSPKSTSDIQDAQHTQEENEVWAQHRPEESRSPENEPHILLLMTPFLNFPLKTQQIKNMREEKKFQHCWRKGNRWENSFTVWVERNVRKVQ